MIVDGIVEPMELGHLPYKKATYEDYVGLRGLEKWGKKKWRRHVADVVARLVAALEPDDVVLGGGNVKKLKELPPGCRAGDNANAFLGGFRLWEQAGDRILPLAQKPFSGKDRRRKEHKYGNTGERKRPRKQEGLEPLTKRKAWKALQAHYKKVHAICICATSSRTTPSAASA